MASPTDSTAPDAPTSSSTWAGAKTLVDWLNEAPKWIRALSPNGAAVHDTGWQNITLDTGFITNAATPSWAREGKRLELRGGIAPTTGAFSSAGVDVGTINLTPPYEVLSTIAGPGVVTGKIRIATTGRVTIWGPAGNTLTYARLDGVGWKIY